MTRILLLCLLFLGSFTATAQELPPRRAIKKEVRAWQKEQNHEMATEGSSPMDSAARANFTKLPFYTINLGAYQAVKWERCADSAWFEMPTTTEFSGNVWLLEPPSLGPSEMAGWCALPVSDTLATV